MDSEESSNDLLLFSIVFRILGKNGNDLLGYFLGGNNHMQIYKFNTCILLCSYSKGILSRSLAILSHILAITIFLMQLCLSINANKRGHSESR